MYSLFEEQVRREHERDALLEELHEESFAEALTYFPAAEPAERGVARRLRGAGGAGGGRGGRPGDRQPQRLQPGGWVEIARADARRGAAAIELNIYFVPAT